NSGPERIVLLFLDGVGIGPALPERNPFAVAQLSVLDRLLGGSRLGAEEIGEGGIRRPGALALPIDATLGTPGLPQSGTGQTTLLTGRNAAAEVGRHFGPWVPTPLRPQLVRTSIFRLALDAGVAVAFANAHPDHQLRPGEPGSRRPGALSLAAAGAGLLTRGIDDVRAGRSLASSITNTSWRRYVDADAPEIDAASAGALLASIADAHDFTVFAHY